VTIQSNGQYDPNLVAIVTGAIGLVAAAILLFVAYKVLTAKEVQGTLAKWTARAVALGAFILFMMYGVPALAPIFHVYGPPALKEVGGGIHATLDTVASATSRPAQIGDTQPVVPSMAAPAPAASCHIGGAANQTPIPAGRGLRSAVIDYGSANPPCLGGGYGTTWGFEWVVERQGQPGVFDLAPAGQTGAKHIRFYNMTDDRLTAVWDYQ
jgi:hypothetical protein